ncbi:hypothetical protein GC194_03715 [bacterium]|nr:hypothetical protein [bacterium]
MATYPYRLLIIFILFAPGFCNGLVKAQHRILLIKNDSSEQKYIYKGYEILYKLKGHEITTSRIKAIDEQYIYTHKDTFTIDAIDFIGYEKSSTTLIKMAATLTYYGSYVNLAIAYFAYTRLPQVPQVGTVFAVLGLVPLVISRRILKDNDFTMYDLNYVWTARIVEF